jgi:hypothetical protein
MCTDPISCRLRVHTLTVVIVNSITTLKALFDTAFDEIDLDQSGTIDLREFCSWLGT